VDIAGNISKKFSATSVRFPRFSGLCPLWNVHAAFLQPGRIRVQLSRLPDGNALFSVARTVQRHAGGYHQPTVLYSVGIGCDVAEARRLVYADGMDLENLSAAVPIGVSCRVCERSTSGGCRSSRRRADGQAGRRAGGQAADRRPSTIARSR
jgi:predicted transcriptional regulator